ncbi:MAG: hypothetical protein JSW00_00885 [Thermoplasmata archaeon]|nr:MAG: hypothetical protein JSW00_00885 [Thermoplasmata archaeon]
MITEVNKIKMETEFRICPHCGYEDGFHSMFERIDESEKLSWKLICPSCHWIFDIGLSVSL